jgi:hypothetical protein
MLTTKTRLGILSATVLAMLLVPATMAMATAQRCSDAACANVVGSGLTVDYMQGWSVNSGSVPNAGVHIEIEGPSGLIKNCPSYTIPAGGKGPVCQWNPTPGKTVPAGSYCAVAWVYDGILGYQSIGTACINVQK